MNKRSIAIVLVLLSPGLLTDPVASRAQGPRTSIRVEVDMVQLNVAVTDSKGDYVTGLRPWDFAVSEDNIPQTLATFAEGDEAARRVADIDRSEGGARLTARSSRADAITQAAATTPTLSDAMAGASVFILFDKSNYMYRGFVFAQDAIAEFVRSLQGPDRVAFYSYSRDLSRDALLTPDRGTVLHGARSTTAGDNAALYNALLLTLKDASQYTGRKVVVVFSNGPDNSSMVAPED